MVRKIVDSARCVEARPAWTQPAPSGQLSRRPRGSARNIGACRQRHRTLEHDLYGRRTPTASTRRVSGTRGGRRSAIPADLRAHQSLGALFVRFTGCRPQGRAATPTKPNGGKSLTEFTVPLLPKPLSRFADPNAATVLDLRGDKLRG